MRVRYAVLMAAATGTVMFCAEKQPLLGQSTDGETDTPGDGDSDADTHTDVDTNTDIDGHTDCAESFIVSGTVSGKVKGGLTAMVNGIRAFLPGSLVDIRPVKDTTPYESKEFEFKVIKLDRKRNNVVLSRRAPGNYKVKSAACKHLHEKS